MVSQIHPIRAFSDNYIWTFAGPDGRQAGVVDPGDAAPVTAWLAQQGLTLSVILLTHHHRDHVGGLETLKTQFHPRVLGPKTIPGVTEPVSDGDLIEVLGTGFRVLAVPGHTLDHLAYVSEGSEDAPVLFCGDTLFGAGCGRIFEGNPGMMYQSLQRLAALPAATRIYCTHEYTLANLRFAEVVDSRNTRVQRRMEQVQALRNAERPSLPSTLADEWGSNPFLRCHEPEVVAKAEQRAGRALETPVQVFATLRQWKDQF